MTVSSTPVSEPRELVIAIDGPSGSGKSSTSRGVAARLGLSYLDTGSMYRAMTVAYLRAGLGPDDSDGIAALTEHILSVGVDPLAPTIACDGVDVTEAIRAPEVSQYVSVVATHPEVRLALTAQMRRIIEQSGRRMVVEGRDITTVVWPQAQVRVLLVADPAARIRRRAAQLDGSVPDEAVHDQVVRRDRDDSTVSQFESPAEGVTLVDSTYLDLEQVIDAIVALV